MTDDEIVRTIELDLHPIRGKDGTIDLYDVYVSVDRGAPEWIGSRRTQEQCKDAFDAYCRSLPPIYGKGRATIEIKTSPIMSDFISEDDLNTFEGWLKYQAVDPATLTPDELKLWREWFEEGQKNKDPKMGLLKLKARPGEKLYAVAVREDGNLWLVLWVRRNKNGEFFVMVPRAKEGWDPHNSYHRDGTFHAKSFGQKLEVQQRQPLTGEFHGTEHLGAYGGYGPKSAGAICDPSAFAGVVEVPSGILGPIHGSIVVDLVEPGHEPLSWPFHERIRQTFKDDVPWIVFRVGTNTPAAE